MFRFFRKVHPAWLFTWLMLYLSFSILAIFWPDSLIVTILRCSGIFLNIIYVYYKFRDDSILETALGVTFLADIVLAINHTSTIGLCIFCFVQLFHFIRLQEATLKKINPNLILVFFSVVATFAVLASILGIQTLYILATIYFITLTINIALSIYWHRKQPSIASMFSVIGFILFFICDTCVGFAYFSSISVLPIAIQPFANYFSWFFYYPSQILIANSSKLNKTMLQ